MYICGAPALIYGLDAIPDELKSNRDAIDIDPVRYGIRPVETIFGAVKYNWPVSSTRFIAPNEFTTGLENFYLAISEKSCPASILLEIQGAIVARSIIYCNDAGERRTLYETARPNDRDAIEEISDCEIDTADHEMFADDRWNCFFLGSAGSSNYGHWLIDDLPRVKAAAALMRYSSKPLRVVIPGYATEIDTIRMDSIRTLLRAPVHIDLIDPRKPQFFPRLFYATPVSEHPVAKSPIAMDFASREILSSLYAGDAIRDDGQVRKIFVRRRAAHGRRLLNEEALLPRLVGLGFAIVDTQTMSFADQARTFAQATMVVGAMGAAMANTLFCRPHTRVVHVAPNGWIEPFYLDLAVVRGHAYQVLYGEVVSNDQPAHLSDYTIDIDMLIRAIAKA